MKFHKVDENKIIFYRYRSVGRLWRFGYIIGDSNEEIKYKATNKTRESSLVENLFQLAKSNYFYIKAYKFLIIQLLIS